MQQNFREKKQEQMAILRIQTLRCIGGLPSMRRITAFDAFEPSRANGTRACAKFHPLPASSSASLHPLKLNDDRRKNNSELSNLRVTMFFSSLAPSPSFSYRKKYFYALHEALASPSSILTDNMDDFSEEDTILCARPRRLRLRQL